MWRLGTRTSGSAPGQSLDEDPEPEVLEVPEPEVLEPEVLEPEVLEPEALVSELDESELDELDSPLLEPAEDELVALLDPERESLR
jgi:chemosensory pili system protein ChpA (sensor histidine kinase/response regulator)